MEKTIQLIGVEHSIEKLTAKKRKFFEENIMPNQVVGLEVPQRTIEVFEKTLQKKSPNKFWSKPDAKYFYEIFKIAKQKNCKIVPLTNHSTVKKYTHLRNITHTPVREKQMYFYMVSFQEKAISSRIILKKPTLCVIGVAHLYVVNRILVSEGIKTKIFALARGGNTAKECIKIRQEYRYRKILRQKIRQEHNIKNAKSKEEMLGQLAKTDLFLKVPKTRRKYFK